MSESSRRSRAIAAFAEEVRQQRQHLGISQTAYANLLNFSQPLVSKVERGEVPASSEFAKAMDKAGNTAGVYARRHDDLFRQDYPDWFKPYADLEQGAAAIVSYSSILIEGLAQTEEYAAAVFRATNPTETEDEVRARVELRVQRQQILNRPNPPRLWMIVTESVLRMGVGGAEVMRGQLGYLAKLAERPNVTFQILRARDGAPPTHLPFILLTVDGHQVAYSESWVGGGSVDRSPETIAKTAEVCDHLRMTAASAQDSLDLLRSLAQQQGADE
ncbi:MULTISPECIES: helix-turn-helix domain-containing protein [Streptomyces]|uniref:Scr1 family TA system antitoxin-like transcriptional regulator n=1 Tax=Streptomyces evansiae TaxID=3075535 RepID=A0ABU2R324_9ACTN|nr:MULTISPECIES: Scr1 family TA system antitoxin-like transcriptional regulator [unclassified Streptomyces]MDT0411098.1 Scr1 family TA system antitoxin-like transcriptional regulator [Streptomyces sp. DSM 41979]MYQ56604.1 helix-turn-helix domain-containing protein [Streptomyces sp. SID4926]SCD62427.1 Helix-turn-helix domain-containing protein [Streptomyces sp. DfronAA-171]